MNTDIGTLFFLSDENLKTFPIRMSEQNRCFVPVQMADKDTLLLLLLMVVVLHDVSYEDYGHPSES